MGGHSQNKLMQLACIALIWDKMKWEKGEGLQSLMNNIVMEGNTMSSHMKGQFKSVTDIIAAMQEAEGTFLAQAV